MERNYLFTSARLGFRLWSESDFPELCAINEDAEVMRYFPSIQSPFETSLFIQRISEHYFRKKCCYFAIDLLERHIFLGFIGLMSQRIFSSTPMMDIGWRLAKDFWHQGYATEGAKRCLAYGFEELGFQKIWSIALGINKPSLGVMKKVGMRYEFDFIHPRMDERSNLQPFQAYSMEYLSSFFRQ